LDLFVSDALSLSPQINDSRTMTEEVDLTVFAIFAQGCEGFGLGVCNLPAWSFGIKISRTSLMDIIRATHDLPARFFAFPRM
jgi:hypothetical protein